MDKELLRSQLMDQFQYFSYLQYHWMQQSNQWGDAGREQIDHSFMRIVLKLGADENVQFTHQDEFKAIVQKKVEELNLDSLSITEAKEKLDAFEFKLGDKTFSLYELDDLNDFIKDQSLGFYLQGGFYGDVVEMIIGEGEATQIGEYEAVYLTKEIFRTPTTIVAMAAVIGNKNIFVRKESLSTIYNQKWVMSFQQPPWGSGPHEVSHKIKEKVYEGYKCEQPEDLAEVKSPFIQDMKETVLYHEVGHGVIQHNLLDEEIATLGEASKLCGENGITALLELLADIAPLHEEMFGPLYNMTQVAQDNPQRAENLFYMYLSDTWFYDVGDLYMFHYSDLISCVMIHYVGKTGVQFEKLEAHLQYPLPSSLVTWALNTVSRTVKEFKSLIETLTFPKYEDKTLNDVRTELTKDVQKKVEDSDSYNFQTAFWIEVLTELQKSPENQEKLTTFLTQKKLKILNDLLNFYNTEEVSTEEEYRTTIQKKFQTHLS